MKLPTIKQVMKAVKIINAITTGVIIVHEATESNKENNTK